MRQRFNCLIWTKAAHPGKWHSSCKTPKGLQSVSQVNVNYRSALFFLTQSLTSPIAADSGHFTTSNTADNIYLEILGSEGLKAPHNSYNPQDLIYFSAFNISLLIIVCSTQELDTGQANV